MTEKTEDKFVQWILFATGISSILDNYPYHSIHF